MDETLRQLGDLLLGSIPTLILFLLTYAGYRLILHRPLERVLGERHQRTTGAMEKARADVAAAEAKTFEYEQRLREAKAAIFKAQEARRQKALEGRSAAVAQARAQASAMVAHEKEQLHKEAQAVKVGLQVEADKLAAEVIRTILRPLPVAQSESPIGGAR